METAAYGAPSRVLTSPRRFIALKRHTANHTYNQKDGELVFVRSWTATRSWVLEVEVETVEVPVSKELNTGLCEYVYIRLCFKHRCHFQCAEIPAAN